MNFEVLGKSGDNYLIYKEVGGKHHISEYGSNMQLLKNTPIQILPERNNLLDISFIELNDRFVLLYQYQEGDIVYLAAAPVETNGTITTEPVVLDTTQISYKTENKIYSILSSNDNGKVLAFKVNKGDRSLFRFTTLLFHDNINQPVVKSQFSLPMEYKGDYLAGYSISNSGDFAFVKYHRENDGNISEASFIKKPSDTNEYKEQPLNVKGIYLDDIKVMPDDTNERFLITSFYSTKKRGNIDGIYTSAVTNTSGDMAFEKNTPLGEELKKKVGGKRNTSKAFNDFFINNIMVHKNGSFSVSAEALYNTENWDRWGFWVGDPYWGGGFGWGMPGVWGVWGLNWGWGWGWNRWGGWWPYSYYAPLFYRSYWWGGWGSGWMGGGSQRFNAGNMAILSFDNEGNKSWDNVILKSQSQDNTDGSISYQVLPGNDEMRFLINKFEKISSLVNIVISNDGVMQEGSSIKAQNKKIDFMPKYGKQTGSAEMIIPYAYKKNIAFAKLEF